MPPGGQYRVGLGDDEISKTQGCSNTVYCTISQFSSRKKYLEHVLQYAYIQVDSTNSFDANKINRPTLKYKNGC